MVLGLLWEDSNEVGETKNFLLMEYGVDDLIAVVENLLANHPRDSKLQELLATLYRVKGDILAELSARLEVYSLDTNNGPKHDLKDIFRRLITAVSKRKLQITRGDAEDDYNDVKSTLLDRFEDTPSIQGEILNLFHLALKERLEEIFRSILDSLRQRSIENHQTFAAKPEAEKQNINTQYNIAKAIFRWLGNEVKSLTIGCRHNMKEVVQIVNPHDPNWSSGKHGAPWKPKL